MKKYRPNVCVVVVNENKKLLICKRNDVKNQEEAFYSWQFPQGGIDSGETVLEAAYRELYEETSIPSQSVELISILPKTFIYDFPQDVLNKWKSNPYAGQEQHWVMFKFIGKDSDINLKTETPEFSDWKWETAQFALDHIFYMKKNVYAQALPLVEKILS